MKLNFDYKQLLLLAVSAILYSLIPSLYLKLFFLFMIIYFILNLGSDGIKFKIFVPLSSFMFSVSFLYTPIVRYYILKGASEVIIINLCIAMLGIIWLCLAVHDKDEIKISKNSPTNILYIIILAVIVSVYCGRFLFSDVPYLGDEFFHITAVEIYTHRLKEILSHSFIKISFFIFLLTYLIMVLSKKDFKNKIITSVLSILIIVTGCFAFFLYRFDLNSMNLYEGRSLRYPVSQAWFSAFLVLLDNLKCNTFQYYAAPLPMYRFLMPVYLFIFGIFLLRKRNNIQSGIIRILGFFLILTIPLITYYSSVLYLDLGVVILLTIMLFDVERVLQLPSDKLSCSYGWWCLIFAAFFKESILPFLLIISFFRIAVQIKNYICNNEKQSLIKCLFKESIALFILFSPIIFYLMLRGQFNNSRPYGMNFLNLLDLAAWKRTIIACFYQVGAIIILAISGIYILSKQKKYLSLSIVISFIIGIKAFFIIDNLEWLTLARFNLYILPGIIYLSWIAIEYLIKKRKLIISVLILTFIISINLIYSPMTLLSGNHKEWHGYGGEYFYPYLSCFYDIKQLPGNKKIVYANTDKIPYSKILISYFLNWHPSPPSAQWEPFIPQKYNIPLTLKTARENNFNIVVFQIPDRNEIIPVEEFEGFIYAGRYNSDARSLDLWISKDILELIKKLKSKKDS